MKRRVRGICSAALALAMASLCSAVPAAPQSGTGLYEPFPEAAVKKRAERYVERLSERTPGVGRAPTQDQLAAGVFVSPAPRAPALVPASGRSGSGPAGARAGVADSDGLALPLQLLLAAAALLPIALLRRGAREI